MSDRSDGESPVERILERAVEIAAEAVEAVGEAGELEEGEARGCPADALDPVARASQFSSIKLLGHLDRIGAWQQGARVDPPGPITIDVDPTLKCNSRCPSCTYAAWHDSVELDRELFRSLVDQAAELGVKSMVFTGGGEPLLHPYLPHAIQLADSLGIEVGLITNGLKLDDGLARRLLENDCMRWIRIGLNAGTPDGYARASGLASPTLLGVAENMRRVALLRQRVDSRVTLGASVLVRPELIDEIPIAAALVRELGFGYVQVKPFEVVEDGKSQRRYENADADRALRAALTLQTPSFRVVTSRTTFFRTGVGRECPREYEFCHGLHFLTSVGADGKVYACCHTKYDERFEFGDLTKEPLKEILRSKKRRDAMFDIDVGRCLPHCRLHEANELLGEIRRISRRDHLNFI